jgi:hypothetical protein
MTVFRSGSNLVGYVEIAKLRPDRWMCRSRRIVFGCEFELFETHDIEFCIDLECNPFCSCPS